MLIIETQLFKEESFSYRVLNIPILDEFGLNSD